MTEVTPADSSKFVDSTQAIEIALRSINPIVWVRSHEESRLIAEITELGTKLKMDVFAWSLWQGLVPVANFNNGQRATGAYEKTWQPPLALDKIAELEPKKPKRGNIVIMRDVHVALQEPIPRQLRDIYKLLIDRQTKLVFVSPMLAHGAGGSAEGLPPTLEKQITVLDFSLPTLEQIDDATRTLVRDIIERNTPKVGAPAPTPKAAQTVDALSKLTEEQYHEFSRALQGLTLSEVQNTISASIQHCKTISISFLLESKKQILSRSDILEYFEPNRTMNDIGGMDLMKDFFEDYKYSHTKEAQDFGIDALRGVLMVGIPGCGKSQMCKAVSTAWKLPLIRLDVGKVMTGLVGGSESKMRSAIKQVEAIAPCITGDSLVQLGDGSHITAEKLYERIHNVDDPVALMGVNLDSNSKQPIKMTTMLRREAKDKKLLKITVGNKSIKVTDNHKLLTQRGWVEAKDLNGEDQLLVE